MVSLNEEQLAAVHHPVGRPAVVCAGAGAGKTSVLTARVKWLMDQGVPPKKICVLTFTNRAANELKERLGISQHTPHDLQPRVGTIHSLALSAIRRNPLGFGLQEKVSPLDDYDQHQMMKKIIERVKSEEDAYRVLERVEFHRARGCGFAKDYDEKIHELAQKMHGGYHAMEQTTVGLWKLYEEEKTKCSPPGTRVRVVVTPPRFPRKGERFFVPATVEERPIEEIKEGDRVVSWQKSEDWTYYRGRSVTKVASREYSGDLLTIYSSDMQTRVTPNHWLWVKFNPNLDGKYLVYLMFRTDFGYKIGVTRHRRGAHSGLNDRMKDEKAEKGWILRVCETREEAMFCESLYSFKYRIPQTQFVFNNNRLSVDRYRFQTEMFQLADPKGGERILQDHKLLVDYPLIDAVSAGKWSHRSGTKGYIRVAACNLLPGFMNVPVACRPTWDWNKRNDQSGWRKNGGAAVDRIERGFYTGRVYSLEVEDDHTYLSDGIVVGNCSVVDFSDMLWLVNRRVKEDSAWRAKLERVYEHVLQDESQDSNKTQWEFINNLLAPNNQNLICIGDLNQSIFAFQGAQPGLMKEFSEGWRGVVPSLYKIQRNHRSVPEIVRLANAVCGHMVGTIPLKMISWRGEQGDKGITKMFKAGQPSEIATNIAHEIYNGNLLRSNPITYRENCVLVRSAIQIRDLEGAFVRLRIPYIVRGGRGLLQTEEVRDVLSYLRLATNPKDFMALVRSSSVPRRGVGEVALEKIRQNANAQHNGDLVAACLAGSDKLSLFVGAVRAIQADAENPVKALETALRMVNYRQYILDKYKSRDKEKGPAKLENLERFGQLLQGVVEETDMTLEDVVFQLSIDRQSEDDESGKVVISTIHAAKGLEWRRVYIFGVVEGKLPHQFSMGNEEELSEERRLLYVAVTRARDILVVCVHGMEPRFKKGQGQSFITVAPSRFLAEIGIS